MPSATQSAPAIAHCPHCAAEVPVDADRCSSCGRLVRERSARITLAITLLLIFAAIALTQSFVNLHRQTEMGLARRWFARGEQAMQAHLYKFASDAYRTALNYDRENEQYRLRLAQALMGEGSRAAVAEARAHLLSLWEEEPANGEVNLTLARLEAQRQHSSDAIRYYNDAINGVWQDDPRKHRTEARFELAHYLMQQHNPARAQAELLALLADAPSDPADQLLLGQMLLRVNDSQHALQAYSALLASHPDNAQAWLGSGQAYLALGNYAEAEHASARAVEHDSQLEAARSQLDLARELLRIDPAQRGLPLAERADRTASNFEAAFKRLNECAIEQKVNLAVPGAAAPSSSGNATTAGTSPTTAATANSTAAPGPLQLLYTSGSQKQADATAKALRKNPDGIEPMMQYVFEVEQATAPLCPNMSLTDRALLTLAQHESESPK